MLKTVSLSATLMIFWLLMSGIYTPLLIGLGVVSVALTMIIVHRMNIIDQETHPTHILLNLPRFIVYLFIDLVNSSITVVKLVWQVNTPISPTFSTYKIKLKTDVAKVIYANAITVTPGTIAIDLDGDEITVHALVKEGIDDLMTGEKETKVRQLVE